MLNSCISACNFFHVSASSIPTPKFVSFLSCFSNIRGCDAWAHVSYLIKGVNNVIILLVLLMFSTSFEYMPIFSIVMCLHIVHATMKVAIGKIML